MFDRFGPFVAVPGPRALAERERAYLAAAVSRQDLERREREVERGLFRQPHPYF